jgi:hypothetical protein
VGFGGWTSGVDARFSFKPASALRLFVTIAVVMCAGGVRVFACPVCFGAEESSIIDGTKVGILVLLAITFVVQGGFLGFFFYLHRRAKRHSEEELEAEWSNLQRASRTS